MSEFLNFMGDTGDYKFHPRLDNPFGLRGNPDTQANCPDQGDGLNGTPEFENFNGAVQDHGFYNHPGFISGLVGGGNDTPDQDGDGIPDGVDADTQPVVGPTNQDDGSTWWSRTFGKDRPSLQLSEEEKRLRNKQRSQNFLSGIQGFTQGFYKGSQVGGTQNSPLTSPNFQPGGSTQTTTTTTQAGMGGDSKVLGYVLIGAVVVGGLIYAVSLAGKSQPASPQPPVS